MLSNQVLYQLSYRNLVKGEVEIFHILPQTLDQYWSTLVHLNFLTEAARSGEGPGAKVEQLSAAVDDGSW